MVRFLLGDRLGFKLMLYEAMKNVKSHTLTIHYIQVILKVKFLKNMIKVLCDINIRFRIKA
jgi:hypothetical protein